MSSKGLHQYIDSFYEAHQTAIIGVEGAAPEGACAEWRMGGEGPVSGASPSGDQFK